MLSVLRPGLLTTVQDQGRPGWQDQGISAGGAMDQVAAAWANRLVGNADTAAVLEITLAGPTLRLSDGHWLALAGAPLAATLDDRPLRMGCPVWAPAGSLLVLGTVLTGCRSYLAVAGGFDVPLCLGSRATALRAGFGGLDGRPLQTGDELAVLPPRLPPAGGTARIPGWSLRPAVYGGQSPARLRLVPDSELPDYCLGDLLRHEYALSPQSDRMGLRLQGTAIARPGSDRRLSAGLAFGSVQLPPDGLPIVLGADRQSTGGYPLLGTVASVDHSQLAQLRPGGRLHFAAISVEAAQALLRRQQAGAATALYQLARKLAELGMA